MKTPQIWCRLRRLPIQQKVTWGYGLALGVAIAGTGLGIILADQQQQRADAIAADARIELELITRLKGEALQVFVAQQQFKQALANRQELPSQYAKWQFANRQFQQSWEEFEDTEGATAGEENEREGEVEAVESFLETYGEASEEYFQAIDRFLVQDNQTTFTPEEIARLQTDLSQLEQGEFTKVIGQFIEELMTLLVPIIHEEYEAAEAGSRQSYALRWWVIGLSMATSVAIATVLSALTSRAIARPIQSLTEVTQQALNESNFTLQAPVTTEDEVGLLATSFNQLIVSVKTLLDQQQQYSQTLELKVAERTQELSDKNSQLQDLLEKFHQTQMQMLQSEKMSSLGQLVAGVAHEINNPINFIHGNLAHLEDYACDLLHFVKLYQIHYPAPVAEIVQAAAEFDVVFVQEDLSKLLNSMKIGTDRIREIVISLRNFSRLDESEFKTVDIHEGIDSTLLILQHRLKESPNTLGIEVIRDYAELPPIDCYPGQLNQVLMNILANAIDAIEEQQTQKAVQEPGQITIRTAAIEAQWIQISIADNGPGIPDSIQKQIFDPFFTTKEVGKGTGIGMAISYQIIAEKHNGKLVCFSTLGKGTEFIIQIPARQKVSDRV